MVTYLSRDAWGARDPRGRNLLDRGEVDGIAVHWPGTTDEHATAAEVAEALRGWQDYHMDGRGWSDIAYQVAVDMAGRAWTLRGLTVRSGANGGTDVNRRYGALLLVLSTSQRPSAAMLSTAREVIRDFRELYPDGDAIQPHSGVRPEPTACPGAPVRAAIARGDLTPRTEPEGDMDMWTDAQIAQHLANQKDQLAAMTAVAALLEGMRYDQTETRKNTSLTATRLDSLVNVQFPAAAKDIDRGADATAGPDQ